MISNKSSAWYFQLHWQILIAMGLAIVYGIVAGKPGANLVSWVGVVFLRLLKMVVVPLIFFSLVSGVSGVGNLKSMGRLSFETIVYYIFTSLAAIILGLTLANLIHPGDANLLEQIKPASDLITPLGQLATPPPPLLKDLIFQLVPENVIEAMVYSNDDPKQEPNVLGVIFFALLFGASILSLSKQRRESISRAFEMLFDIIMKIANWIIRLAPLGVFALLADVVSRTGFSAFSMLGWYILTVFIGLSVHAFIVLPLVCMFVACRNPLRFVKAMAFALATAFSTASSYATLPVVIDAVENRARISNQVASFVLPLGATINMDGTALHQCVAVLLIAQCYGVELSLVQQLVVVLTALLVSIGVAGIPHAGLVMLVVELTAVGLPIEAEVIGMILAVDRILDMCRTVVNVFSNAVGAVTIARLEGEEVLWS